MSTIKRTGLKMRIKKCVWLLAIEGNPIVLSHSVREKRYNQDFLEVIEAKRGQWFKIFGLQRKFLNFTFWRYPTLFLYGLTSKVLVSVKNLKKTLFEVINL